MKNILKLIGKGGVLLLLLFSINSVKAESFKYITTADNTKVKLSYDDYNLLRKKYKQPLERVFFPDEYNIERTIKEYKDHLYSGKYYYIIYLYNGGLKNGGSEGSGHILKEDINKIYEKADTEFLICDSKIALEPKHYDGKISEEDKDIYTNEWPDYDKYCEKSTDFKNNKVMSNNLVKRVFLGKFNKYQVIFLIIMVLFIIIGLVLFIKSKKRDII